MISVLGASGFIGSRVVAHLANTGHEYQTIPRDRPLRGLDLGHVIYCVGVTADFRRRPFDTVRAHVCLLSDVLEAGRFDSLLYLSSTRLYRRAADGVDESQSLTFQPSDASQLYDLSKTMGESLCLSVSSSTRVARLSNVFGPGASADDFLPSVIRAAIAGRLELHTALDSEKDYVSVDDVAAVLVRIALGGRERIYNVASGVNVTNGAIAWRLAALTGCEVSVAPGAPVVRFPRMSVERIEREFAFQTQSVLDALPALVGAQPSK